MTEGGKRWYHRGSPVFVAPIWFIGWLFTIGYANLVWWKILLALVIWPYFLGSALSWPVKRAYSNSVLRLSAVLHSLDLLVVPIRCHLSRPHWSVYRTLGIVFTWWCPATPTGKTWPWWYWLWLSNQPDIFGNGDTHHCRVEHTYTSSDLILTLIAV